jgi:hypothetical protein
MMPFTDWQFIAVSVVALGALAVVLRRIIPARRTGGAKADPACDHCATNPASTAAPPRRTTTIPFVSLKDLRNSSKKQG